MSLGKSGGFHASSVFLVGGIQGRSVVLPEGFTPTQFPEAVSFFLRFFFFRLAAERDNLNHPIRVRSGHASLTGPLNGVPSTDFHANMNSFGREDFR